MRLGVILVHVVFPLSEDGTFKSLTRQVWKIGSFSRSHHVAIPNLANVLHTLNKYKLSEVELKLLPSASKVLRRDNFEESLFYQNRINN